MQTLRLHTCDAMNANPQYVCDEIDVLYILFMTKKIFVIDQFILDYDLYVLLYTFLCMKHNNDCASQAKEINVIFFRYALELSSV